MTTKTSTAPDIDLTAAQKVVDDAAQAVDAAYAVDEAAAADVPRAQQALADAEAKVIELLASTINGDGTSKAQLEKARAAVEKCKGDVEWSMVQRQAAEVACQRATDNAARAHRALTADQHVAEFRRFNDPTNRERVLLGELTSIVAELVPTIRARKAEHGRLMLEYVSMPADEQRALDARLADEYQRFAAVNGRSARAIAAAPNTQLVPPEMDAAFKAGLAQAAAEREQAKQIAEQARLAALQENQ